MTPAACRALAEAHDHRRHADAKAFATWFDAQFFNYFNAHATLTLRPLAQSVVELCERHHGPDHVETARALTNLARMAVFRREMDVAEPALRRALAIQERELGVDHLDTARTVAVLGGYLQGRGDYAAAEPFFRRALEVRERLLGAEHPLTVGTLSDVAYLAKELDRLDEAENLSRRVLQVRERTAGPETPETADRAHRAGRSAREEGRCRRRRAAVPARALDSAAAARCRQSRHRPDDVAPGRGAARARPLRRGRDPGAAHPRDLGRQLRPRARMDRLGTHLSLRSAARAGRRGGSDRRRRARGEDPRAPVRRGARGARIDAEPARTRLAGCGPIRRGRARAGARARDPVVAGRRAARRRRPRGACSANAGRGSAATASS